ncbi:MAG: Gfo/Idh/MocA family oxidoreductase [Flavobacteriaceae bacterium]|jgi:predicted dehydrogenase|nr:Gfo/Idh/MocA family oxidoreductase [Flavobacteriaceae bacterium]
MNPLRIAICGFGRFTKKRILPVLNKSSRFEVIAIVGKGYKESEDKKLLWFETIDELFQSTMIDCIYIATPNYLHASQTIKCLKKGVHVFCEKPMAINSVDCKQMIFEAEKNKLQLSIGHMLRYSTAINKVKNLIENNILGVIHSLKILFNYDVKYNQRSWAISKEYSGGGALIDAGVHCIDTIQYLINEDIKIEDCKLGLIDKSLIEHEIESNFTVKNIKCSMQVNSNKDYLSHLEIFSDNGLLTLENFASTSSSVKFKFVSSDNKNISEYIDVEDTYQNQMDDFADNINSFQPDLSNTFQALNNIKVVEKIYEILKIVN